MDMIVDVNPFVYSRPISPDDILDRDDETHELLRKAVGGHYVRLYAPRKYGKTSLLKRALRDGEAQEGLIPVLVDLYRVNSIADVTIRFERAYARHLKGPIRAKIEELLQRTGLGLSLGAYGISAKIRIDPKAEPLAALHTLLDLPTKLEESGGYRALIAFDEFQDVGKIEDLDGLIRSHIQHHGDLASYVFAGSEPGLMKQLFENKQRPLYGSAVPMRLGRLQNPDIADYVADRFAYTGRGVGEGLGPLLETAEGHPQRVIMLAHHLWEQVPAGQAATLERWVLAHAASLAELKPEFDAMWRGYHSAVEQKTLRSIVAGEGSAYRTAILRRLDLEKSTASAAVERLLDSAEIEAADSGKYRVVDPLYAEWIGKVDDGSDVDGSSGDENAAGVTAAA
jgi:AAA+ ATPase superfamily predicted ATPase